MPRRRRVGSAESRTGLIHRVAKKAQLYARLRDCGGKSGGANCISCNKWFPFAELDGGHFISRRSKDTIFDEKNINAQCRRCNRFLNGNERHQLRGMIKKYGEEVVEDLESREYKTKKWTVSELIELDQYYTEKIREFKD